jgi:hypothetical protein
MLGLGLIAIRIYLYFYSLANNGAAVEPIQLTITDSVADATVRSTNIFAAIITTSISILLALALIALIAKIYNGHMRSIIARAARLFKVQIFTIEIIGTLIAWTITVLMFATLIPIASIIATFAFIINELLFIFAWGSYGQPNYKI